MGTINENLILDGAGPNGLGALENEAGDTAVWAGNITLVGDTTFGADVSNPSTVTITNSLLITGQISDSVVSKVYKVGDGQIIFANANTYRGQTEVDDGILTIENADALGNSATYENSALVVFNSTNGIGGTLQILNSTGTPFSIQNELLTLNGPGFTVGAVTIGALDNTEGNNVWTDNVTLGSAADGVDVNIDVDSFGGSMTNLLISGRVQDPVDVPLGPPAGPSPYGPFILFKDSTGRLIFTDSNTYTGETIVLAGALNVEDSQALGQNGKTNPVLVGPVRRFGARAADRQHRRSRHP